MYKKLGMCAALLLCACTTDSVPDEEFEGPTGNFPLLGTVPDRPKLPLTDDIIRQEKRLKHEHDQATQKQNDVLNSTKP